MEEYLCGPSADPSCKVFHFILKSYSDHQMHTVFFSLINLPGSRVPRQAGLSKERKYNYLHFK